MKEAVCYVARDFDAEMHAAHAAGNTHDASHALGDGRVVTLRDERFRAAEPLFQPAFVGQEALVGVHELLFHSIMKGDVDIRTDLVGNIVLAGGGTLFPGFAERLTREVSALVSNNFEVKVIAPPDRKFSAWVGGSVLASLSTFQQMWVTRKEYDESGPAVVHRKCF